MRTSISGQRAEQHVGWKKGGTIVTSSASGRWNEERKVGGKERIMEGGERKEGKGNWRGGGKEKIWERRQETKGEKEEEEGGIEREGGKMKIKRE